MGRKGFLGAGPSLEKNFLLPGQPCRDVPRFWEQGLPRGLCQWHRTVLWLLSQPGSSHPSASGSGQNSSQILWEWQTHPGAAFQCWCGLPSSAQEGLQ